MATLAQIISYQMRGAFPATCMTWMRPYALIFKTTNYCWFKCAHCCENAGPNQPREYIPVETVENYITQATDDPFFGKKVVFTGGEVFSAYRFGPENYVPDLLKLCTQRGLPVDIKTNAGWARTSFGDRIFSDLCDVTKSANPYTIQISMSLDRFHTNCVENVAHVISELSKNKCPVSVHVSSFNGHDDMFGALEDAIESRGAPLGFMLSGDNMDDVAMRPVVGTVPLEYSCATLFDGGRAKNMPGAHHTEMPQFSFMTPSGYILSAFDSFGNVTLGENSGRKISVPWRDKKGNARPLPDIWHSIWSRTLCEEMRQKCINTYNKISR